MTKIFLKTFGCTLNQKDSEDIVGNHILVNDLKDANIVVVNTCGVKEQTETKIVKYLRDLKKEIETFQKNKEPKIIVTGCLVTINQEALKNILPHAIYFEVKDKKKIQLYLNSKQKNKIKKNTETIIISNGCLGNCSYCAVKFARGKLKSKTIDEIKKEIEEALEKGTKEILLTSQDTSTYGLDIDTNIVELLEELIKIDFDFKIRLGMANPQYLKKYKKELVKIFESKKLYKFLHIPLQSGNNRILKKMNRGYSVEEFEETLNYFKQNINDLTLSTDIIVGFPGESEEEFEDSINILKKHKFDIVNISRFGRRKNIEANKYPDLHGSIKKERSRKTTKVCKKIAEENNKKYLNKIKIVRVIDHNKKDSVTRTQEYKQVIIKNKTIDLGKEIKVKIIKTTPRYLIGKIEEI